MKSRRRYSKNYQYRATCIPDSTAKNSTKLWLKSMLIFSAVYGKKAGD